MLDKTPQSPSVTFPFYGSDILPACKQDTKRPPKFLCASLPACHGLMTPADLHIQATRDDLVLPSAIVKTLGVRNKLISKLYQHFRVRGHPYGLQDSLCTLHLFCSPTLVDSATGATLGTGGWLTLT